jgi:hypothetical protein
MQTSSGIVRTINKGQINHLRQRPAVINEHVESAREAQGVVTSSNIVGQIFKASQDNINGIQLTLESAGGASIDNFESYANDAALQAVWVLTGSNLAVLSTAIAQDTKSMQLPLDALNDEWADTIASTNYTGYTFSFEYYQDISFANAKMAFFLEDSSANTASTQLSIEAPNSWQHFDVPVAALADDGAATDLTDIIKIGFRVDDSFPNRDGFVDDIVATPSPGSIGLKLWDMGTSIPTSGVTSIDSGTQYTEIGDRGINGGAVTAEYELELVGGKRSYSVKGFAAGVALEIPSNTLLTPNNYYALTLHYIDTNTTVYGPDTSFSYNYYTNGYAFTAPNESTAITAIGQYSDITFAIFSTQNVYVNTLLKIYDAQPGVNATESVYIEDENMKIIGVVAGEFTPTKELIVEFKDRVFPMYKGSKFEVNYNDDATDSVTTGSVLIGYIYEPPTTNG